MVTKLPIPGPYGSACPGEGRAQLDGGYQAHETAPMSINDAWTLWAALLDGNVR
ncbi:hypothetical protein HCN51_10190 [Nonomuraea sp. FMUSA5-5]|uniref:Uncharacterized protein n=1 Tax=Nonomuraea composti TaxID=2720023 RepID=A0ABX1B3N0_9ACTN|nr:hypothetical protein [Nonomuraea sp. FMUSA5-5]NJP89811.1 hypothetical protein [Nonomuraea sp. FMUSA5-5]